MESILESDHKLLPVHGQTPEYFIDMFKFRDWRRNPKCDVNNMLEQTPKWLKRK